jgi:putative ABC transport system permease protein
MDSIDRAVEVQFEQARRSDLRVDFLLFEPPERLERRVRGVGGLEELELLLTLPVQVVAGDARYETAVQGLPPSPRLLRAVDFDGVEATCGPGGVVLARGLARRLGVRPGDELLLRSFLGAAEARVRVDALADSAIGGTLFMNLADAQQAFGRPGRVNTALLRTSEPRWEVRQRLQELRGVVRLEDTVEMRERFDDLMELSDVILGLMLLFSVLLGASILFNTATQSILERERELATMRSLGLPMSRIALQMTAEHAVVGAVGLLLGIPASLWTIRYTLSLYESDLFSVPFFLSPGTLILSLAGVVLVLLAAQLPSLAWVGRLDLAASIRERDG